MTQMFSTRPTQTLYKMLTCQNKNISFHNLKTSVHVKKTTHTYIYTYKTRQNTVYRFLMLLLMGGF